MPCLNNHEVSDLLLGTLPSGAADESERHLLVCERCVAVADQSPARDRLVEALQAPDDELDAGENAADRSAISSLIERLGGWANDVHAPACSQEELQQILAPRERADEIGRLAHFRILEVLGAGGMGIVFKAEDVELERIVALKVMRPALAAKEGAKRRFRREALAAAAFEHENIVTIYQVEEDRGVPFFSMQWLEGESLRDRLRRRDKLPVAEALRITREIATGLAAAHARGLLHRDIKPDNIWLHADEDCVSEKGDWLPDGRRTEQPGDAAQGACPPFRIPPADGRVKIVDFGLVRSLDEPSSLTHSGMIVGTPQYMAPEQACGEEVDGRSDLFSVGCVLYHMLTGRPPFVAPNVVATLVAVSKADVTPPHVVDPAIPRRISDLAMRLLAREPDRRIASAAELARETAEIERDLPKLRNAPVRPPRRQRLLFGTIAAGLAAIVFGVITVQTNQGTLVIEADGDVAVLVEGDAVELHDKSSGQKYELRVGENPVRPGEYEIVSRDPESGLEFSSREFGIHRGDRKSIRVTLQPPGEGIPQAGAPPVPQERELVPSTTDSRSATVSPAWPPSDPLSQVETTLGIEPGEPLSPFALVQQPRKLADGISYTIEPADHRGGITDAAFSADGSRIATAGQDGTVRIYDARNFHRGPEQIIVCPGAVARVVWSPTGKYLATAIDSPTASICVWLAEGDPSLVGKIYRSTTQLAWSPDGELLAFGDGGIQFWSLGLGVLPSFGITGEISHRPWSPDGRTLATLSHEGKIQLGAIMDNRSATRGATLGRLYKTPPVFADQGDYLAALDVPESENSSSFSRSTLPHSIHVWDAQTRQRVRNILLGRHSYTNLAWAADSSRIAAIGGVSSDEHVSLWDVKTGERLPMAEIGSPLALATSRRIGTWSPDGQRLVVAWAGHVMQWNAESDNWTNLAGTNLYSIVAVQGDYLALQSRDFGSDGWYSAAQIDVWHVPTLQQRLSLAAQDVESLSLSPSGRYLAVVGPNVSFARPRRSRREGLDARLVLHVYETQSGKLLGNGEFQAAASLGAQWSPDEEKLLLQSVSGRMLLVDASTSKLLYMFDTWGDSRRGRGFGGRSSLPATGQAFAWSPQGDRVAWRSDQTSLAITNFNSGETEQVLDFLPEEMRETRERRRAELIERVGDRATPETLERVLELPEIASEAIAWSADGKWVATRVQTTSNSREYSGFHDLIVWNVSQPQPVIVNRIPMSFDDRAFARPFSSNVSFSPDGERLTLRWSVPGRSDALQCWDTESGQLVLDEQIEGLSDFLGWLPDGKSLALSLSSRRQTDLRLGLQTVGGDAALREKILHGMSGDIRLVGDRFHVGDPYSHILQILDAAIDLQSSYLFVSDDAGDRHLVRLDADGTFTSSDGADELRAVLLTEDGSLQIFSAEEFNKRLNGTFPSK